MTLRQGSRLGERRLQFQFDGQPLTAQAGDTIASALLANGISLVARSIKYHRPRGILAADQSEPNALVTVGVDAAAIANVSASSTLLHDGMIVRSQSGWPTLGFDLAAMFGSMRGVLSAGFYYKTFMWPSWRFYEPMIRRLAGLGPAPTASDAPIVEREHIETGIAIAGGGAAGLIAALSAARTGARVVLIERDSTCGGELDFETASIDGKPAREWIDDTMAELLQRGVRILTDTTLVGESQQRLLAVHRPARRDSQTMYRIHARACIRATGAVEQPIAFINNDAPGVMLAGAAELYLARYGVHVGKNVVLFGNHDRLYATAKRLLDGGVNVQAVVDTRAYVRPLHIEELRARGVECMQHHAVRSSHGRRRVHAVTVVSLDDAHRSQRISCDTLLVSGGWVATGTHGAVTLDHLHWSRACGAAAGAWPLQEVLNQASGVGIEAARVCGYDGTAVSTMASGDPAPGVQAFVVSPATPTEQKLQFVDLQNDVTVADLRQAIDEGFVDIEHIKRYTTLGVGTDQGATASALGAAIALKLLGKPNELAKPSRRRLPLHPISLAALSGPRIGTAFAPIRRTPLHDWHVANGAVMESMGLWMRPRYYRSNGSDASSAGIAEAARARQSGGFMDASTLGKIEVHGRDAAAFLDSVCLMRASLLRDGRSKYTVILREDGMVIADGLIMRLANDRFITTVSSDHADHLAAHFQYWRDRRWSDRRILMTDVTEAWAAIAVAGLHSRKKLSTLLGRPFVEALGTLAHMSFFEAQHRGQELRILRASYAGELGYELHCRPDAAVSLCELLIDAGLKPYGIEALDVLRTEKGYLGGSEMNGQTTPYDLGLSAQLHANERCIGSALLNRAAFNEPERQALIGIRAADGRSRFLAGAQIVATDRRTRSAGHVTSAVFSPALSQWVGLALIDRSVVSSGVSLLAMDPLRQLQTAIVTTAAAHFDPTGERMKST